jgi:hypothetical protein
VKDDAERVAASEMQGTTPLRRLTRAVPRALRRTMVYGERHSFALSEQHDFRAQPLGPCSTNRLSPPAIGLDIDGVYRSRHL